MALDPLATVADLEARGVTVETDEETLVGTYLDVASEAVREAAGVPISQTTSTVTLEGPATQWLHLPGPPITAVSAVAIDGEEVTDWRLRSHQLWRAAGWSPACEPSEVEVTQTHGLPTVPADIVDLVCRLALGTLIAHRRQDGGEGLAASKVWQERIGDYFVMFRNDGGITEMELPGYLREQLAARFGGGLSLTGSR